jgi:DNA-binding CsgD family transcriptional regulator
MDSWLGLSTPGESPQVADLRARSASLVTRLATLAHERAGAVQHLVGLPALVLQLRRIAPAATDSARVMQPQYAYDPEEPGVALTRAARLRGVETKLITRPATVDTHPLLSSIFPTTLLGPVFLRALIIDGRQLIVGGPDDASGRRTSWYTTVPDVVEEVTGLWEDTVGQCRPILEPGEQPPLTDRQLQVAQLLCVGEDHGAIARTLRTSAETVQREVRAILDHLGARNPTEATLVMRGRGVNGGWRRTYA